MQGRYFPVAQLFKYLKKEDFSNVDEVRSYIYEAIASFRISKGRGIIAKFDKYSFDEYLTFSRIGDGSIGGKARGWLLSIRLSSSIIFSINIRMSSLPFPVPLF